MKDTTKKNLFACGSLCFVIWHKVSHGVSQWLTGLQKSLLPAFSIHCRWPSILCVTIVNLMELSVL